MWTISLQNAHSQNWHKKKYCNEQTFKTILDVNSVIKNQKQHTHKHKIIKECYIWINSKIKHSWTYFVELAYNSFSKKENSKKSKLNPKAIYFVTTVVFLMLYFLGISHTFYFVCIIWVQYSLT